MTRHYWTVSSVLDFYPCLSEKVIRSHFADKYLLTVQDILTLPNLSAEHKVWMANQLGVLSNTVRQQWKDIVLTRIITKYALTCGVQTVEHWASQWLDNTDRTAAKAAKAAWAAKAAEYETQVNELLVILAV